jgi:hypothetical protein
LSQAFGGKRQVAPRGPLRFLLERVQYVDGVGQNRIVITR